MSEIEFNYKLLGVQNHLRYFASTLTSNREEANDLIQDTNLKALVNKDKFSTDTNFKAWTYTIMKNTFINNYRRTIKSNTIVDSTNDLYFINTNNKSDFPQPDSIISEKEILRSIENLNADQRLPFEMHHAGYKYKEIADKLDLSIGTVKSRIFFTRKKLMNDLRGFEN
ncbi:MAG TPA: RNA polymerase sigma factor [Bacteroidales bacterium]|nr:RNA polymerase sigma factor [Bacteroidales bacterium]